MDFGEISWLAILLAAAAFFALGGIYYGPLFGDRWMQASGVTEQQARESNLPLIFVGTFVLQFVSAIGLAAILGGDASVGDGAWAGLVVAVLIVVTTLGVNALYERRGPVLFVLNAGYNLLGFVAMGAIIGWLQ